MNQQLLSRRRWLAASAALLGSGCADRQDSPMSLAEMTIADVHQAYRNRKFTCESLTRAFLDRIERMDRSGPQVGSVIEVNPDAIAIAQEADKRIALMGDFLPLLGIPVLIKDNIDTGDKMKTTAGSLSMVGAPTPPDAPLVKRLREAGAVILGKTNLSEWANIRSSRSTSGWSGRGGQTKNPYDLRRNPSGSSSGSGAAVAANFCIAAVGTETDGSVVSPSSINGIVGLKPTVGMISGQGIIPISHSQDTAGPMTRTVADAAAMFLAMRKQPSTQTVSRMLSQPLPKDFAVAVVKNLRTRNPDVVALFNTAIDDLKRLGIRVNETEITTLDDVGDSEFAVLMYELKADMNAYLAKRGGAMKSLADVIEYNKAHAAKEMPHFGQETFKLAQTKGDLNSKEYLDAVAKCRELSREKGIDAALKRSGSSVLIAPTDGPSWFTDYVNSDHFTFSSSTMPAVSGYPHLTVPMGLVRGLPIGISFMGGANQDELLLQVGHLYEQATKRRRSPQFSS